MNDELKLGYHRLGKRFEDPAELFGLAAGLWAIVAMMVSIVLALGFTSWFMLTGAGVVALWFLRGRLQALARRWRTGRVKLENGRAGQLAHD